MRRHSGNIRLHAQVTFNIGNRTWQDKFEKLKSRNLDLIFQELSIKRMRRRTNVFAAKSTDCNKLQASLSIPWEQLKTRRSENV